MASASATLGANSTMLFSVIVLISFYRGRLINLWMRRRLQRFNRNHCSPFIFLPAVGSERQRTYDRVFNACQLKFRLPPRVMGRCARANHSICMHSDLRRQPSLHNQGPHYSSRHAFQRRCSFGLATFDRTASSVCRVGSRPWESDSAGA
jgi:hypothetical protein